MIAKIFHILVMVRLAAVLATEARMAGRATLVPMEEANREATMRAEAIVMDGYVNEGDGGTGEGDSCWDGVELFGKAVLRERKELADFGVCGKETREGNGLSLARAELEKQE